MMLKVKLLKVLKLITNLNIKTPIIESKMNE